MLESCLLFFLFVESGCPGYPGAPQTHSRTAIPGMYHHDQLESIRLKPGSQQPSFIYLLDYFNWTFFPPLVIRFFLC